MSNFKTWEEVEKELNFTEEENAIMEAELEIVEATIEARKQANITQQGLSKKTGLKQSAISRIEKGVHSPSLETLIKILYPMGYTLKVVPLNNKKHR